MKGDETNKTNAIKVKNSEKRLTNESSEKKLTYLDYVKNLERLNWLREKNIIIHESNSAISTIYSIGSGNDGIVLDILCPAGRIMTIPGIKDFPEAYDIERIPYFELKLSNGNKEIDPDTRIKIIKHRILRKDTEICEVLYRDIGILNYSDSGHKFKYTNQLYRFNEMIELKGEDHLKIFVINPDIDINIVKFNTIVDFWTPAEFST